jgi:hypothetical protein
MGNMSISPYLGDFDVNPETKRILGVALEMTRVSLGLADDFADRMIAKRIIELARAGERRLTRAVIQAPSLRRPGNGAGGAVIRPSFARPKGAS